MVTDRLSDFVTRVRNAYLAGLPSLSVPSTKMIEQVARVLVETKYLASAVKEEGNLQITLRYSGKTPAITGIERVSRPGARIYRGVDNLPKVLGGLGINILTTPKGVISDKQAKKINAGGEVIVKVW